MDSFLLEINAYDLFSSLVRAYRHLLYSFALMKAASPSLDNFSFDIFTQLLEATK